MPFFGNNVAGVPGPLQMTPTDCVGHWDPAGMVAWGLPVPACVVTMISVDAEGPTIINATAQFGIYDASSGVPANYPLVATSPTFILGAGTPRQWHQIPCSIPLAAGTYSLAFLSNSAGTWTGGIFFTVKALGANVRAFITPGLFPNPLGGPPTSGTHDWSMYADYSLPARPGRPNSPTAACYCQPKCGD